MALNWQSAMQFAMIWLIAGTEFPTLLDLFIVGMPVGRRYCDKISFLLDFHRDVDGLRVDIEGTSLYDFFFQHQNDAVAIT